MSGPSKSKNKNKTGSSRRWLREHFSDVYVKKAQQSGFRSRAVYKLEEIQDKDKLFKPGMVVIDLGAAPGSWSQYVAKCVGKSGRVFALDILPIDPPLPAVTFLQGDFREESVMLALLDLLGESVPDWVISDMAPNMSGIDSVDQPRSIELAELALDLALRILPQGGGFLVKVFQGAGFDAYLAELKRIFKNVTIRKPKASRDRSREVYVLAKNRL